MDRQDLVKFSEIAAGSRRKSAHLHAQLRLLDRVPADGIEKVAMTLQQCKTVQDFGQFLSSHLHRTTASGQKLRLNLVTSNPQLAFDTVEALLKLMGQSSWGRFVSKPELLRPTFNQAKNQDPGAVIVLGVNVDYGPPPPQQYPGQSTGSPVTAEDLRGYVEGESAPGHAMIFISRRPINSMEFKNVLGHNLWVENFDRLSLDKFLVNPVRELGIDRSVERELAGRLDKYSVFRQIQSTLYNEYRTQTGQTVRPSDLPRLLGVSSAEEAKEALYAMSEEAVRQLLTDDIDTYDLDHRVQQATSESLQSDSFSVEKFKKEIREQADAKLRAMGTVEDRDGNSTQALDPQSAVPKPNVPDKYLTGSHSLGYLRQAILQSTGAVTEEDPFEAPDTVTDAETHKPNGIYVLRGIPGTDADVAAEFVYHYVVDPEQWRIMKFEPNSIQSKYVGESGRNLAQILKVLSNVRNTIIDVVGLGDFLREVSGNSDDANAQQLASMNKGLQDQFGIWLSRMKNSGEMKARGIIILIHDAENALAQKIDMAAAGAGATVPFAFPDPEEFGVRLQNVRAQLPPDVVNKGKFKFAEAVLQRLFQPGSIALDMVDAESKKFDQIAKSLGSQRSGGSGDLAVTRMIPRFRPGNLNTIFTDFANRLNVRANQDQAFRGLIQQNGVELDNWDVASLQQLAHIAAPLLSQAIHATSLQTLDSEAAQAVAPSRDAWITKQYETQPKGLTPYRDPSGGYIHRNRADELAYEQHQQTQQRDLGRPLSEYGDPEQSEEQDAFEPPAFSLGHKPRSSPHKPA